MTLRSRFHSLVLIGAGIVAACAVFAPTVRGQGSLVAANDSGQSAAAALRGLDPVLLTQGKETRGRDELFVQHKRHRYLFADADTRARFEREPDRYAIQAGGQCAVMPGVTGNPQLFTVHKGRIYIFGTEACHTAFRASPDEYLKPRKNVAIFLYQGVELLDFAGPGEVFAAAGRGRAFNVYTVAATAEPIVSQGFVTVTPQYTVAACPKPDILVLPGGSTRGPLQSAASLEWIEKASQDAQITLSVCTGAFLLAKLGLLDGKQATTHWASIQRLREQAPRATVVTDRRFVDNGKIITSAGVSAGTDAALHIVKRLLGEQAARYTARYMEYRWEPAR